VAAGSPTGSSAAFANGTFASGEKPAGARPRSPRIIASTAITVRRALATLAERGLVRPERGSGLMRSPAPRHPLRSRTRFSEIVGAGGQEPRGQLIEASDEVATGNWRGNWASRAAPR